MAFEQLGLHLALGVGMGVVIAIMGFLSSKDEWNNKLFAYTIGIGVVTTFTVIEGIEGGVDESNLLKVIVEVAGLSFFANKGVQMAQRLQKGK